ncbi:MAG: glycerol-3-phosphate 1-O-acyltransferase PlsY [Actinobacteria bacterium]|nr:MAG: glycerol-3-phosphate 1-O-acyltransferase PlsY [Actinomycetota bacterium]
MTQAAAVLGGYLLGSLPFGYWLVRVFRGEDIRTRGSGNTGATNVLRLYGRRLGTSVALLDAAKGFTAAAFGLWAGGSLLGVLAGAAAMLGHARPVFLGFRKGGKMVATAGGAALAFAPLAALSSLGIWLAVFSLTRYASVASIATALAFPLLAWLYGASWPVLVFAFAGAAAIVLLHRHNVRRLVAGTEHRFHFGRPRGASAKRVLRRIPRF